MAEGLIYFRDGKLVAESGDVRAYIMNGKFYLEKGRGHSLWTHEDEIKEYIYQLKDYPKGECLEIGLGLGVASKYILSFPLVDSLTTVELDENVIKVQREVNYINDERHLILNADGLFYAYQTKKKFDFIFLDFYSHIDEETLPAITDMSIACKRLLKPKAVMTGWLDPATLEEHMKLFYKLFD
jgi:spermidine synthase